MTIHDSFFTLNLMKMVLYLLAVLSVLITINCTSTPSEAEDSMKTAEYFLLDDFTGPVSALNTQWEGFTDRVMGGVSDISVSRMSESDMIFIRMQGAVSTKNNGGFIQIRLKLKSKSSDFNIADYQGIRLTARGINSGYYIFVRTSSTIFPWQYYSSEILVREDWSSVDIPWSSFKKGDFGTFGKLNSKKINSIAIVAYGKDFDARFDVTEIGFY